MNNEYGNEVILAAASITGYKPLALLALSPVAFRKLIESIKIIEYINNPKEVGLLIDFLRDDSKARR